MTDRGNLLEVPVRCKGGLVTDRNDSFGHYYGSVIVNGRSWAIVVWDGEEDPDLCKAECLLFKTTSWTSTIPKDGD